MGVQAHERQDELFELRRANRMMLHALTCAICGDAADWHEAEQILADLATDPRMASNIHAAIQAAPELKDRSATVLGVVRTTLGLPLHETDLALAE